MKNVEKKNDISIYVANATVKFSNTVNKGQVKQGERNSYLILPVLCIWNEKKGEWRTKLIP